MEGRLRDGREEKTACDLGGVTALVRGTKTSL